MNCARGSIIGLQPDVPQSVSAQMVMYEEPFAIAGYCHAESGVDSSGDDSALGSVLLRHFLGVLHTSHGHGRKEH